jgi:DNA-directed RNA polymerase sigma subunit (sigma70/sigma32)
LTERPRTLRELGKELSLSGERVRQMEQVLFESLRDQVFEELAA